MSTQKRRLFLSFSRMVNGLEGGRITPSQIRGELFFLGCTREYTFDPIAVAKEIDVPSSWNKLEAQGEYESSRAAQKLLTEELRIAEKESRVMYKLTRVIRRQQSSVHQWGRLNRLLEVNGLPALALFHLEECRHRHYDWGIRFKSGHRPKQDCFWRDQAEKLVREGVAQHVIFNPDGWDVVLAEKLIKEQLDDLVEVVL